jgi:hypothetical protein
MYSIFSRILIKKCFHDLKMWISCGKTGVTGIFGKLGGFGEAKGS